MSETHVPSLEVLRGEGLARYSILDTAPEADFDDLTRIAARSCATPIALLSFVDDRRQWFKAAVGTTQTETSRASSFCQYAIRSRELMVVPDARSDERFTGISVFREGPPILFYAGAPLVSPEGDVLGTLCVMDYEPRVLTADQQDALRVLGRQAMAQLNLRRRAGEVAARERLLLNILDLESEGILVFGVDGRIRQANRAALEFFDTDSSAAVIGRDVAEFVVDTDRRAFESFFRQAIASRSARATFRLTGLLGTVRWIDLRAAPLETAGGDITEILGVAHDLTERKYTSDEREKLMLMIQRTPELIAIADLEGHITFMNAGGRQLIGLAADSDISTLRITDYVPEHWLDFFRHTVLPTALAEGIWEGEMQLKHLVTNELFDVYRTMFVINDAAGNPAFFGSILRNVSARKQAERAWRESEARYRTLFEYAPDGILIADRNGHYLDANASICALLGYTQAELVGKTGVDLVAPNERDLVVPARAAMLTKGAYLREWKFRRKDGTLIDAEVIGTGMPDGNLLAMVRDVTERKRIAERFRRLVDSNVQGVLFYDAAGEIAEANDAFLAMTGYTRDDLAAGLVHLPAMTPPAYAELDRRGAERIAESGTCAPYEKEYLRKDGSRVPVMVGAASFVDNPNEGVCFVLDLSERKKLEQQFLRGQRLESIGTLAGGIAHDLNNVLGPIVMAIDLLKLKFTDAESTELLGIISTMALRGTDMVRQVLSFARGVEGRRVAVQLRHLILDIKKIISETFPKNIVVRVDAPATLWTMTGEPTQLHQVLMNLCVNARDAMPNGGQLTISASNRMLDSHYVSMNPEATEGPYLLLQIEDTGTGIAASALDKIFDPFFTTKDVGKGTGLGLSTSLAIVKSHGGFIRVYSELGHGSKFDIYLPAQLVAGEHDLATPTDAAVTLPRGHGELVLVVDDELSVRRISQQTLETFGYRVLVAVDGADAVATYAEYRDRIAVVITDMMMPVLDGPATIQVLRKMNPDVRVIAVSGLATNAQAAQAAGLGVKVFLAKPYTADALLTALADVLRDSHANS